MKSKIIYGFFAFLLLATTPAIAQRRLIETRHEGKTWVMLTPQYVFIKQFRVEIDKKIADQWFTFAPHYVQNIEQYRKHHGFGLVLSYKYFWKTAFYSSIGIQATQHRYKSWARDPMFHRDLDMYDSSVLQYGANLTSGVYFRMAPHLFGDIYGGFGYRLLNETSTDDINHSYGSGILSSEYKGLTLVIGIRVGIML